MHRTEVLIVGAGPTGLGLALWLTRLGVSVRIVDENRGPGETSRAFFVQARTLEHYGQLGLAEAAVKRGRKVDALNLHRLDGVVKKLPFGDFGQGLSPYPFMLVLHQDQHEKLLIDRLAQAGVEVERQTALIDLTDERSVVTARLRRADGVNELCQAAYVCGCDGFRSTVRALVDIPFDGLSSPEICYVADVEAEGPLIDGEAHYVMTDEGLLRIFPLQGKARVRLIGFVPRSVRARSTEIKFEDVADAILLATGLRPWLVEWFSIYQVHHRIARSFREGRTFLLGDAAHTWGPALSQGMNTGLGDAANLAWKLAAVLNGRAGPVLLRSYGVERKASARQIARAADLAFLLQAGATPVRRIARDAAVRTIAWLMGYGWFRKQAFRAMSQVALNYRPLRSSLAAASLGAGDRLPWVRFAGGRDNFEPLRSLDWHVQVHGRARPALKDACERLGLALHDLPWTANAAQAGFIRDAAYLVRPDGYLALVDPAQNPSALEAPLSGINLMKSGPEQGKANVVRIEFASRSGTRR